MGIMDPLNKSSCESEDIWTPYKELHCSIEKLLSSSNDTPLIFLEEKLHKFRQNFLNLLKNVPRDEKCRAELRQCASKNVAVPGRQNIVPISQDLMQETIILSDLFEINEYVALDLLCVAERQLSSYPGLTRGLVAVLLYYDGRKALCDTLCLLAQARRGVSWQFNASPEVSNLVASITDQLVTSNLIGNILELLNQLEVNKEIEKLQKSRGLGGHRHHRQVVDLLQGTRQTLADTVFCLAAQAGLTQDPLLRLIKHLQATTPEVDASGRIDGVTMALQMALLYALDLSVLQRREDGEELVQRLPLVSERQLIPTLMRELRSVNKWKHPGLEALTQLAWGMTLCMLRQAPSSIKQRLPNINEEDEFTVDTAIDNKVFDFLHRTFLTNENFGKEEFYMRRMHNLLTEFLVSMPLKVKEMKNAADETAKVIQAYTKEGLRPPEMLDRNFEHFLLSLATLYQNDKLGLELSLEFWSPSEAQMTKEGTSNFSAMVRSPQAQVTLYKFLQNAGEMLPPALFVPYLKLLTALASGPRAAKHAFQLLSNPTVPGNSSSVSWEHFFKAIRKYASNLSQEATPAPTDSMYRPRGAPRGINPQELHGLHAVLGLIKTVAEQDAVSRLVLAQNSSWAAIPTMLALVRCAVPVPLKAEILLTLASLSRSPEVASEMWQQLEASGILNTVPSTSSFQPRGIQTELEEVEARSEEFPLSRALVTLLLALTETAELPLLLGVGRRTPGLSPYLYFVMDCFLLKFHQRAYRRPEEKWEVAEICLALLDRMISMYEPSISDLSGPKIESTPGAPATPLSPPPGHSILIALNCNSELLTLILYCLHQSCGLLDTYTTFPGKSSLQRMSLHALNIIHQGLIKGPRLAKLMYDTPPARGQVLPLLTGLDKLIFTINSATGHMDHPLNIAKFVGYADWLPKHALVAVRVLHAVAQTPTCQANLVRVFVDAPPDISTAARHYFVECLDSAGGSEMVATDESEELSEVSGQLKEEIVSLLQQCLNFPAPTLAHFLLGYNTNKPLRHTILQHPGILGCPRTCLHSILNILDSSLPPPPSNNQQKVDKAPYLRNPKLMERCWALVHKLCVNPDSAKPTFRFLRACSDFLARHVSHVKGALITKTVWSLGCCSWVLRCVAVDMKLTAGDRQRSPLMSLMRPLLALPSEPEVSLEMSRLKPRDPSLLSFSSQTDRPPQVRELIARLLQNIDFSNQTVTVPTWKFFDPYQVDMVLKECEFPQDSGTRAGLIDISILNQKLRSVLTDSSSSTIGQREAITDELREVLNYAMLLNQAKGVSRGSVRVVEAWRQLVVVLFSVAPSDQLPLIHRHSLLLLIIKLLLSKIQDPNLTVSAEVGTLCSSVLLLLLQSVRQCHVQARTRRNAGDMSSEYNPILDDSGTLVSDPLALNIDIPSIKSVLTGISHWLHNSSSTSQMLRANLYGSLLSFLYVSCFDGTPEEKAELGKGLGGTESSLYVRRLDQNPLSGGIRGASEATTLAQRRAAALVQLTSYGEILLSVMCADALGGHEVSRMLSLSCIAALIRLGPQAGWASFMCKHGYLQSIVDSLPKSDAQLMAMLKPSPATLKPLYVYEAKMALMCRLALNRSQAETLLRYRLLSNLSDLCCLDCYPYPQVQSRDDNGLLPSITLRYQQILLPSLLVCDATLSSLGKHNQSCVTEIVHFLVRHGETVSLLLRGGSPDLPYGSLRELCIVVSLLARCAEQTVNAPTAAPHLEASATLQRFRQLTLSLLPRFLLSQNLANKLRARAREGSEDGEDGDKCFLLVMRTCCHLLVFARTLAFSRRRGAGLARPVFRPCLGQDFDTSLDSLHSIAGSNVMKSPELGLLLSQLGEAAMLAQKARVERDQEVAKLAAMQAQPLQQMREDQALEIGLSRKQLETKVDRRKAEVHTMAVMVEQALHLLWAHLDLYLRRNLPQPGHSLNESLLEPGFRPSLQDLSLLKEGLIVGLSDKVEHQIRDSMQDEKQSSKQFVSMLIRRIKRLVQFVPI